MLKWQCAVCGEQIEVPAELIGQVVECPKCSTESRAHASYSAPAAHTRHFKSLMLATILGATIGGILWVSQLGPEAPIASATIPTTKPTEGVRPPQPVTVASTLRAVGLGDSPAKERMDLIREQLEFAKQKARVMVFVDNVAAADAEQCAMIYAGLLQRLATLNGETMSETADIVMTTQRRLKEHYVRMTAGDIMMGFCQAGDEGVAKKASLQTQADYLISKVAAGSRP